MEANLKKKRGGAFTTVKNKYKILVFMKGQSVQQGVAGRVETNRKKKKKRVCCVRSFFNKGSKMKGHGETCCLELQNYPDVYTLHPVRSTL